MKYILMDYVNEAGWPQLTRDEKEHWLGLQSIHGGNDEGWRAER
jgi:hypothetical protein